MKRPLRTGYPVWLALVIYWSFTFAFLGASLAKTNGHFGYPLDDTYIHMAMARHLAQDGYFGISTNGFSSTSSSPLWTGLLAVTYKTLGVNDRTPFVLCLLFGSLIVVFGYHWLREISNPIRQTAYLVFVVLLTPLPVLTLFGMEHVLQILIALLLIYLAATFLAEDRSDPRTLSLLMLLAGLATITRYEDVFLVAAIVMLFLIKRRFLAAFLVGGAGFVTVAAYGIYSILHGWYFFPNSVLLKSSEANLVVSRGISLLLQLPTNVVGAPHVLVLLIACLITYLLCEKQEIIGKRQRYTVALFAGMSLLHLQFAAVGGFYRYEAYIVCAGSLILIDLGDTLIRQRPAKLEFAGIADKAVLLTLLILLAAPLARRMAEAFLLYPTAVKNIYEQQYQMGRFLERYYSGKSVAINDVGAVDYLADVRTLDLFGLASMEVARAKMNGTLDEEAFARLTRTQNVEVAIIYTSWFESEIPPDWVEVGRWTISDNVICSDSVVTIYAPGAQWENVLATHLKEFSRSLPTTVKQSGSYTTP